MSESERQPENIEGGSKNEQQESENAEIIQHNLKLLKGNLFNLLRKESIGGNAGSIEIEGKSYPCMAANGYADPEWGVMTILGNSQSIEEETKKDKEIFTLRVSITGPIVELLGKENFSERAIKNIEQTIELYNGSLQKDK